MSKVKKARVTNSRMEIWCGYRTKDGAECGYSCPNYHRARLVKHTKKHHPSESDILIRGSAAWVSVLICVFTAIAQPEGPCEYSRSRCHTPDSKVLDSGDFWRFFFFNGG